jgi:hypothetical protein
MAYFDPESGSGNNYVGEDSKKKERISGLLPIF